MKTKLTLPILTLLVTLLGAQTASAAARTASVTGNWNNTATWGGAAVPIAADTVTINAGVTVTVNTAAVCTSMTLIGGAANSAARVTISGANTLTVSGAITINGQTSGAGSPNYVDVAAGTLSAGSLALAGTTSPTRFTQLLISTGTATVTGIITSAGTASRIVFSGTGTLNAGGTFLSGTAGTFTASTGTVNFNRAGTQTVGAYTFNNLTLSGTSAKTVTGATINGTLSIQGTATATGTTPTYGASAVLEYAGSAAQTASTVEFPATMSADVIIDNASGVTLSANNRTLNGNLTLTAGTLAATTRLTMGTGFVINRSEGSLTATTLGGTYDVNYTGNSKTTGPELLGGGLRNVTVALTTGQTLTLDQNRAPDGNLLISSGTFDLSTFTFNRSAAGGTLTVANGATLRIGGTGTLPSNYTTYTINANSTSTVEYYGTAQIVGNTTYGNLVLSGSGTKTLQSGTTALSGSLTLSGAVSATTAAGLAISGNLNIGDGTTLATASTFTLGVTGTTTLGGGTSGTLTLAGTGAKTFTGDVTINAGGVWNETGVSTYSIAGSLQNGGTLTANTGVHTFTGASKTFSGASTISIPSVTVSGTYQNNGTLTVNTALAGSGTLTQGATGILNIGGTSTTFTLVANTVGNTVKYTGTGQTLKVVAYDTLTLASGVNVSLPNSTISSARSFWVDTVPQLVGSWGSTGSAATHKNNTYFNSATSGILNVGTAGGLFGQPATITSGGGTVTLKFYGVKGYTYQVQKSTTSPSGPWSDYGAPITDTTGGPLTVDDTVSGTAYYQLKWQP